VPILPGNTLIKR